MVVASRIAERVVRSLREFDSLDEFVEWAASSGAVAGMNPMPDARPGVLYLEPREAVLGIGNLLGPEDQREAWRKVMDEPGRTLEGAVETMRAAVAAAPGTAERRIATKKMSREDSGNTHTNRHVSFVQNRFLGPVPQVVRLAMESDLVKEWFHDRVVVKQIHFYYDNFRWLNKHRDQSTQNGASMSSNLLLQLGGPSVMGLDDPGAPGPEVQVTRTMGSVLGLSGPARCNIPHGVQGSESIGSMSLVYLVPDEIMPEACVLLSVVGTLAAALVLHDDETVTGSMSWNRHELMALFDGLERYEHNIFGNADVVEAGRRGGQAFQRNLEANPEAYRWIRQRGGRAAGTRTGLHNGLRNVLNGNLQRARARS